MSWSSELSATGSGLAALLERAREGDEDAWEALFRRSYPRLMAYAARRLPSTELARDAVGETMARAVANVDRLRDDAGFDAWTYGILRHVVIDTQRRLFREEPGFVPDVADARPGPVDQAVASEDAAEVRSAFHQLSRADQELLELRIVAQLSVGEVATALGRRPGAVRMAQSRALGRLRALLAQRRADGLSVEIRMRRARG